MDSIATKILTVETGQGEGYGSVLLIPGRRYVVNVSGEFSGATLTFKLMHSDLQSDYCTIKTLTAGALFEYVSAGTENVMTVTGGDQDTSIVVVHCLCPLGV